MSEGGISYDWTVTGKGPGVEPLVKQLDLGHAAMSKLDTATKGHSDSLKDHAGHLDKVNDAYHRHRYETEGVGKELREATGRVHEFSEAIGLIVAAEIFEKVTEKVMDLGKELLHSAAAAEKLELNLKLNVGAEGAKEIEEWVDRMGPKTVFTKTQLKQFNVDLASAGVSLKDMDKFIAAAGDVQAKGGDAGSAIDKMMRAKISGTIGGRELRGLKISVAKIREELPGFKGMTDEQVHMAIEKKPIKLSDIFRLIADKEGFLGTGMLEEGKTMSARLKNLGELRESYFEKMKNSPAYADLKDTFSNIFEELNPEGPNGKGIFKSLESAFKTVSDTIKTIDFKAIGKSIREDVLPVLADMVSLIKPLLETLQGVLKLYSVIRHPGNAVDALKRGIQENADGNSNKSWAGRFVHQITPFSGAIDAYRAAQRRKEFADPTAVWEKGVHGGTYHEAEEEGEKSGEAIAKGVAKGVKKGGHGAKGSGKDLVGDVSDGVVDEAEIQSPSKLFERHGKNIGLGFVKGIRGTSDGINDIMTGMFAIPAPSGGRTLAGGGGGISVSIPITIQSRAGDDVDETARANAEQVRAIVLPMLLGALEQFNSEAGSS